MPNKKSSGSPIDTYIAKYPEGIQQILEKLRTVIKTAAPQAEERISYQMPTFWFTKNLVHFAVCKEHIGFYPTPGAIIAFKKDLLPYKTSKGAVQFPLDKPLPYSLIKKMVKFRFAEYVTKEK